ncbi:MAG: RNase P subunit p30 family protein [Candidatus Pacearchaeota archaeon]
MADFVLISDNNFLKIRKQIRESSGKRIAFYSEDDELNRKVLEKEKFDILLLGLKRRKDFQKQRNSGLNQVLANIAKKQKTSIGILLDELVNSEGKEKSDVLGRLKQNIELCKKNNLKMNFICLNYENKRNVYDLRSLGLVLGMPTSMVKSLNIYLK